MKLLLTILLLMTFTLNALDNKEISEQEESKQIQKYSSLIQNINNGSIKKYPIKNTKNLIIRMNINKDNGYDIAYKRDLLKVTIERDKELFNELLENLYQLKINMSTKEDFLKLIKTYKSLISNLNFKPVEETGKVTKEYNESLKEYIKNRNEILSAINFIELNIDEIVPEKLDSLNLKNIVTKIDSNKNIYQINLYLNHIFGISVGKIIVSFSILFLLYLSRFVLLPLFSSFLNKFLVKESSKETKDVILNSLMGPANALVIVASLDIIFNVFEIDYNVYISIAYWATFFWFLNNIINDSIEFYSTKLMSKYKDLRSEILLFFKKIVAIISIVIFVSIALSKLGVEITALLGGVGVIGLGVSLAFKDTFSNFIASVNVIFDKAFSVGDWIEVDNVEGTVIEIGMRHTRIRGFANNEYTIPNSIIASSVVTNWSKRKIGRRIKLKVGLTYDTPKDTILKIKNEIRELLENHPEIANRFIKFSDTKKRTKLLRKEDDYGIKNTILVYVDELNSYSIDILVYAFSKTVLWEEWLKVKEDILINIINIVEKNNATFAFPTQTIEVPQIKNLKK